MKKILNSGIFLIIFCIITSEINADHHGGGFLSTKNDTKALQEYMATLGCTGCSRTVKDGSMTIGSKKYKGKLRIISCKNNGKGKTTQIMFPHGKGINFKMIKRDDKGDLYIPNLEQYL